MEGSVSFVGFPAETQTFLAELRENNDRNWFEAHRDAYERYYVAPARAFVAAAGQELRRFAPGIHAEPRILGSIFRITQDTRYGRADRPYKDHIDLYFWEGERKSAVSGFFARISPDFVGIGAGCHRFEPVELTVFREALTDENGAAELAALVHELEDSRYAISGEHYKREPRGYAVTEEVRRFLRFNALYIHTRHPPVLAIESCALLHEAVHQWGNFARMHRWLTDRIQTRLR